MKRILLAGGALAAVLVAMPMFAAFEAHVVNVTATIENALSVTTTPLEFGNVFPQEKFDKTFDMSLSNAFVAQSRVGKVDYFIRQKPKCALNAVGGLVEPPLPKYQQVVDVPGVDEGPDTFACADEVNYDILPLLCPYLSKHEISGDPSNVPGGVGDNDDVGLNAFHGPTNLAAWTLAVAQSFDVKGQLNKNVGDTNDVWNIDLRAPCIKGQCAQDWSTFVQTESGSSTIDVEAYKLDPSLQGQQLGCDLWVEVNGIATTTTEQIQTSF